jgi:trk system potassium uptake protein TrkH
VVAFSVIFICASLIGQFNAFPQGYTVEETFRHALFQVASIITTTGYSTTDFATWPILAATVIVALTFIGAMAGSSAGGIKISRIIIAAKGMYINVRKLINPRYVPKAKFEGKSLEQKTINDVFAFVTMYFFILVATTFLLAFDPVNGEMIQVVSDAGVYEVKHGFLSNFSAAVSCISNIGPGFEAIGPYSSFAHYSIFSKILLTFTMLIGRLEILPVLILFSSKTWKKI